MAEDQDNQEEKKFDFTGLEASARWASERRTMMQGGRLAGLKQADQAYYGNKDDSQEPARTAGS